MRKRNPRTELNALCAMLFAAGESLSLREMSKALSLSEKEISPLLAALEKEMKEST